MFLKMLAKQLLKRPALPDNSAVAGVVSRFFRLVLPIQ